MKYTPIFVAAAFLATGSYAIPLLDNWRKAELKRQQQFYTIETPEFYAERRVTRFHYDLPAQQVVRFSRNVDSSVELIVLDHPPLGKQSDNDVFLPQTIHTPAIHKFAQGTLEIPLGMFPLHRRD